MQIQRLKLVSKWFIQLTVQVSKVRAGMQTGEWVSRKPKVQGAEDHCRNGQRDDHDKRQKHSEH